MAVEIHVPNIIGPVQLAASEGIAGQQLTSAGPGVQAIWAASGGISILDTTSIDLTLAANVLSGAVIVAPTAGNQLQSTGTGLFVPAASVNKFAFTSASALVHTITHNLNNQYPTVDVFDTVTGAVVVPLSVVGTSVNVLTVTFFAARAIAGTVVG